MNTLIIRKKSLKTWLHTDSILGDFIISKFYFNADNGNFQVVEQGQSKRVIYDVSDITLYDDTSGGSAETFANITALSLRLEALNYPAFQYDGQIVSIANLIDAGTNVTITGDGTEASPYVISATGGGFGTPNLEQVLTEGNESTTQDAIFRLDADKYIKIDRANQVIQFFDLTVDAVNPIAYWNGTQISFADGSGNVLDMSPSYFANNFSDGSLWQFTGALLNIGDGSGSVDLNPTTLQFNVGLDTTIYTKDKITVDSVDYPLPTGATSQIATLLDIPSPITIDATPTDGSSNAVSSNGVFDALALKQDKVTGVSDTEIGYLDGVTSAIQTQLNAKTNKNRFVFQNKVEVTGVTGETNLCSFKIEGGAYASTDAFKFDFTCLKSVTASTSTWKVYIGLTSGARTNQIMQSVVTGANRTADVTRRYVINSGNLDTSVIFTANAQSGLSGINALNTPISVNMANDLWVTITANPTVTSESHGVLMASITPLA